MTQYQRAPVGTRYRTAYLQAAAEAARARNERAVSSRSMQQCRQFDWCGRRKPRCASPTKACNPCQNPQATMRAIDSQPKQLGMLAGCTQRTGNSIALSTAHYLFTAHVPEDHNAQDTAPVSWGCPQGLQQHTRIQATVRQPGNACATATHSSGVCWVLVTQLSDNSNFT